MDVISKDNNKVSIIVPAYNIEKYIKRCIDSILLQTYDNWELILVDDGSTDLTGEICDSFSKQDERIIVIHKNNKGVSAARNDGKRIATGAYYYFIDGDDWLEKESIKTLVYLIEKYRADLAAIDVYNVDVGLDGELCAKKANKWTIKGEQVLTGERMFHTIFLWSATLWNKLIKREILDNYDFNEDMTFGEDTEYLSRIFENVKSVVITDFAGYYYVRNRDGNVVSQGLNPVFLELLNNSKAIFDNLCYCPDKSIGVHRISVIINQILDKIPVHNYKDPQFKVFLNRCRDVARYPKIYCIYCFLKDKRYHLFWRVRYLSFIISPTLYLFYRKTKVR